MKNLLFISAYTAPFVERDREILQKEYQVEIGISNKLSNSGWNYLRIFMTTGWQVLRNDLVYCWFADYRARVGVFWARVMGKKAIVVIGGYEVRDIIYGEEAKAIHFPYILRKADLLITVSDHYQKCLQEKFPEYAGKLKRIYNGIVITDQGKTELKKENLVITVCSGNTDSRFKEKGLDLFIEAAVKLPSYQFAIIGAEGDLKKTISSKHNLSNLILVPALQEVELIKWYQSAKVYCQFSRHESFGLALVEAMAWQCVPVVRGIASLRERVGDCGYVLEPGDSQDVGTIIEQAANNNAEKGGMAAKRVMKLYDIKKRKEALLKCLREIENDY